MRTPTLRQMESLNMDRAAPVLIRIYKEERTLEVGNRTGLASLRCSNHIRSANIQENSGRRSPRVITKRLRDFMTSLQTR